MSDTLVRTFRDTDIGLICDSLFKCMRKSDLGRWLDDRVYDEQLAPVMKQHVLSGQVLIACHPDDPDVIFGWMSHEASELRFVYVKRTLRGCGIATELLESAGMGKEKMSQTTLRPNEKRKRRL